MKISSKTASAAAKKGFKYENKFVDLINNNPTFNKLLKNILKTRGSLGAKVIKSNKPKADAILTIDDKEKISVSVKTSKINFSQLDRRWLKDLAKKHKMSQDIEDKINQCLILKSKNSLGRFILKKYENDILEYFRRNIRSILKDVFTKNEKNLKYLVVCCYVNNEWYISKIQNVVEEIAKSKIAVSKMGIIKIGEFLTMQRKSGNGKHIKIPKTNPRHPGNQIQFKLKPLSLLKIKSFKKIKL